MECYDALHENISYEKMHPIEGEHIEAGEIVHEVVLEEHSSWNDSYSIPLGNLIDVVSVLSPVEKVAQAVYENAKTKIERINAEFASCTH